MWFLLYIGLGILGFVVTSLALALPTAFLPTWLDVGLAPFCGLLAATLVVSANERLARSGTSGVIGAWIGTFVAMLGEITEREVAFAGFVGGAALGMIVGLVASAAREARRDHRAPAPPAPDGLDRSGAVTCPRCRGTGTGPEGLFCLACGGRGSRS